MLNRLAKIALLVLVPLCLFANPKDKGATKVQVVTARTGIHSSSSGNMFSYTNLMFTEVNGKKLVYECAQSGDLCPIFESGQTYTANQDGAYIYIPMNSPEGKKDLAIKFKRVGSW
jgi:hypothetical protein